jgi:hypothetical protein
MNCDEVRQLAPELALGIADGAERAAALRHLAECGECRRVLEGLSEVTDELLMLAPEHEPPAGFESRVLAHMRSRRAPVRLRSRRRAFAAVFATAVATAAAMVLLMMSIYSDDRRLASHYRATLAEAHGSYFEAATLRSSAGGRAGIVFGYQGMPSWIFVIVERPYRSGEDGCDLLMVSGRRVPLPSLQIDPASGSAGTVLPVDLHDVATVRLTTDGRGEALEARLPHARSADHAR